MAAEDLVEVPLEILLELSEFIGKDDCMILAAKLGFQKYISKWRASSQQEKSIAQELFVRWHDSKPQRQGLILSRALQEMGKQTLIDTLQEKIVVWMRKQSPSEF